MLEDIRRRHPRVFAYGFSLTHEATTGLDTTIDQNIPGGSMILGLQFKRAYMKDGQFYSFHINNNSHRNQHNLLWTAAVRTGRLGQLGILYVFPCFADVSELATHAPDFRGGTAFVDPFEIGLINDRQVHEVRIDVARNTFVVHSEEPARGSNQFYTWNQVLRGLDAGLFGVSSFSFRRNLSEPSGKERGKKVVLGEEPTKVSLRGLVLPEEGSLVDMR